MTRHALQLSAPATDFTETFLLGNGRLGAAVHGLSGLERIDLNLDTLWSGGPRLADEPDRSAQAAQLRSALRDGDLAAAEDLAHQTQGRGWTAAYQPLGWLELDLPTATGGDGYRRVLDLARATATSEIGSGQGAVRITSFVSAPDDVLVIHVQGAQVRPVLRSPHPGESSRDGLEGQGEALWAVVAARVPAVALPDYLDASAGVYYSEAAPDADGLVDAGMGFAAAAGAVPDGDGGTVVVVAAASGFRGWRQRPSADLDQLTATARATAAAALARPLAELRERHEREHASWWDRMDLRLHGDARVAVVETYVHLGRYLLIASSRPGTQPANLQGIWNDEVRPAWSCNLTTNINAPMNYWGAEAAGLPEMHRPLLDLVGDLAEAGRDAARRHYGASGASTGHNTDLWRRSSPIEGDPQWANWSSGLAWLSAHAWDHAAFAPEGEGAEAARELALLVLREVVRFVLETLDELPDGTLVASPSTSPEHRFVQDGMAYAVTRGAAMDQELALESLQRFTELARTCGDEDDRRLAERAEAARERVRRPLVADGVLQEWMVVHTPNEPGHRHLSHLYGVFPGARTHLEEAAAGLAAARRALAQRLEAGSGYTGWSQAWVLCLAARLGDGPLAEHALAVLSGELSSTSLLDLHPHPEWPAGVVFQIDGNLGALAGALEVLVQSHTGVVSVLDALPPSWTSGSARGIRARGGHVVDLSWDEQGLSRFVLVAAGDGEVVLDLPEAADLVLDGQDGGALAERSGARPGRRRVAVRVRAGQELALRRYVVSLEPASM